jgi:hypothetical protein
MPFQDFHKSRNGISLYRCRSWISGNPGTAYLQTPAVPRFPEIQKRHQYKNPGTASVCTDAVPGFLEILERHLYKHLQFLDFQKSRNGICLYRCRSWIFVQMPFLHFCQISAFLTRGDTHRFGYELVWVRVGLGTS